MPSDSTHKSAATANTCETERKIMEENARKLLKMDGERKIRDPETGQLKLVLFDTLLANNRLQPAPDKSFPVLSSGFTVTNDSITWRNVDAEITRLGDTAFKECTNPTPPAPTPPGNPIIPSTKGQHQP